ncbi:MAG: hypothetical protein HY716_10815 [Planctomycetes bacterium]|nr:hypothetical protein [Planctomycetota bacterium]
MRDRIALVTAREALALDQDLPSLIKALAKRGIEGVPEVWDDPEVSWDAYPLKVVRSTWDYPIRLEEYLAWAERTAGLANPATVLRWNTDKRHLGDLAGAGVPIVPTRWIPPDQAVEIPYDREVVVKPVVSAGAKNTLRHASRDSAEEHVRTLQRQGRTAMVQPYLDGIDRAGETGLVYFDGAYSHAIRKGAILRPGVRYVAGLYAEEEITSREPSPDERRVADRAADFAGARFGPLLYARVDLAPSGSGPAVLEFEATEPSLFLDFHPGAADAFAGAIERRLGRDA